MSLTVFINILTTIALAALMVSIGLKVRIQEVLETARQIRLITITLIANFILIPFFTTTLLYFFQTPPFVSVGFLILAVCPGAPLGPPVTIVARGNVPVATGVMVILAALSAPLSPVILTSLLEWLSPGSEVRIDSLQIVKILVVTQLLPLGFGFGLQYWFPRITDRLISPVSSLSNFLLFSVVGLIVATQFHTLSAFRFQGWLGMVLLLIVSLGTGWIWGGTTKETRRALLVTAGIRNAAVGLVIVTSNFAGTPAVSALVAYTLISTFGTLICAVLMGRKNPEELKVTTE